MPEMRLRPGLRPGPRWGSSQRSPNPTSILTQISDIVLLDFELGDSMILGFAMQTKERAG